MISSRENRPYLLAAAAYIALASALTLATYFDQKQTHNRWINRVLEQGVESMRAVLPEGLHTAALSGLAIDYETDQKIAQTLGKLADSHGLEYLYTLILTEDNKTKFVLSSPTPEEKQGQRYESAYLADYPELDQELIPIFQSEDDGYLEYSDRWGEFRSLFRPIKTTNGQTYILAADIDIAEVNAAIYKSLLKTALLLGLLFIVSAPLIYLVMKTRQRERQHRIDKLLIDPMTGLRNRVALSEDLNTTTNPQLLIVDLVKFSDINNAYGPARADQILIDFAQHLARYSDPSLNTQETYRIQGDEFAMLIDQADLPRDMDEVFQNFLNYLACFEHKISEEDSVRIKVYSGVALNRKSDVITSAKIALLTAREQAKPLVVYDENLPQATGFQQNLRQLKVLRAAIKEQRLITWFQPIFSSKTNEVVKYEALARVVDEQGNIQLLPADFLPVAIRYGLYYKITRAVLKYCIDWMSTNDCNVNINLSIKDIEHRGTREYILRSLHKSGMGPRLSFELLESEGISDLGLVRKFFRQLARFGCKLGIDDLGKEYSNFDRFMALPLDFIKLDGAVIRAMQKSEKGFAIVEKIVNLAHQHRLEVIAEVISTRDNMELATRLGCDSLQGYYLGMPSADEYLLEECTLEQASA